MQSITPFSKSLTHITVVKVVHAPAAFTKVLIETLESVEYTDVCTA